MATKIDTYKRNQKKIKTLHTLTPIVFWLCIALSILCFCLAVKHSLGNVGEIIDLLDKAELTGDELHANYQALCQKYGEWIIGKTSTFSITFINLKNAVFSGFMVVNGIFSVVFLLSAFLLGKWLLPLCAKNIEQSNQDMVNLTILENK